MRLSILNGRALFQGAAAVRRSVLSPVVVSAAISSMFTAALFTLVVPSLVTAQVDTLRAGQIVAVGDNGADRVLLSPGPGDVAMLSVTNVRGEDRIRLRVETTSDGQPDAGVAIRTEGASPVTMMRLGTVAQDAELPAPLMHSANLLLRDERGRDHIRLLVADDGTPSIQLLNAAGELVWSAP
jgi:hypothetical protein